jgi:hypothetical protein
VKLKQFIAENDLDLGRPYRRIDLTDLKVARRDLVAARKNYLEHGSQFESFMNRIRDLNFFIENSVADGNLESARDHAIALKVIAKNWRGFVREWGKFAAENAPRGQKTAARERFGDLSRLVKALEDAARCVAADARKDRTEIERVRGGASKALRSLARHLPDAEVEVDTDAGELTVTAPKSKYVFYLEGAK